MTSSTPDPASEDAAASLTSAKKSAFKSRPSIINSTKPGFNQLTNLQARFVEHQTTPDWQLHLRAFQPALHRTTKQFLGLLPPLLPMTKMKCESDEELQFRWKRFLKLKLKKVILLKILSWSIVFSFDNVSNKRQSTTAIFFKVPPSSCELENLDIATSFTGLHICLLLDDEGKTLFKRRSLFFFWGHPNWLTRFLSVCIPSKLIYLPDQRNKLIYLGIISKVFHFP